MMENRLLFLNLTADEVHFYLLYDYLSFLFLKSLQNLASCGGGDSIFPELDFKTNMPILKKEPSSDRDRQVGNFFLAARCRCPWS